MNDQTTVVTYKEKQRFCPEFRLYWCQHREAQERVCVIVSIVPGGLCVISLDRSPNKENIRKYVLSGALRGKSRLKCQ